MNKHLRNVAFATLVLITAAGCGRHAPDSPAPAGACPEVVMTKSGIEMVAIPGGSFVMGSDLEKDEQPPHRVEVGPFLMDRHEVTQKAYQAIMGKNPSKRRNPDLPVEQVSWVDAATFCNMRSLREGLQPCYDLDTLQCNFNASGYRLPTEAEWEYACRAGSTDKYCFGSARRQLADYAWYSENSEDTPRAVGSKKANAFGLYDIHGNVWEWCHDVYAEDYYRHSPAANPTGPVSGARRVLRGGCWNSDAESCRASARFSETARFTDVCLGADTYGFRCVRRP